MMETLPTFYIGPPEEDEGERYIIATLREAWVAFSGERIIIPVSDVEIDGETHEGPALIDQYTSREFVHQWSQLQLEPDEQIYISRSTNQPPTVHRP